MPFLVGQRLSLLLLDGMVTEQARRIQSHIVSGKRLRRQRHAIVTSAEVFVVSTDQSHRRHDMVSLVSTGLASALPLGKGRSPSI